MFQKSSSEEKTIFASVTPSSLNLQRTITPGSVFTMTFLSVDT